MNTSVRTLVEANVREAADLVGELTLLLDRMGNESPYLAAARLVTHRISDRLGQLAVLDRDRGAVLSVRAEAWPPSEPLEELEREAASLAGGRIDVRRTAHEVVPQYWFFDRELVSAALRNALHSALVYSTGSITLGLAVCEGCLGFSIEDDGGAFPATLIDGSAPERGACNGNALGVHFARLVASAHVNGARRGRLELANLEHRRGTRFTLWLP